VMRPCAQSISIFAPESPTVSATPVPPQGPEGTERGESEEGAARTRVPTIQHVILSAAKDPRLEAPESRERVGSFVASLLRMTS
jgi:hypothetical protein